MVRASIGNTTVCSIFLGWIRLRAYEWVGNSFSVTTSGRHIHRRLRGTLAELCYRNLDFPRVELLGRCQSRLGGVRTFPVVYGARPLYRVTTCSRPGH